jgi:hypothetical protein
VRLLEPAPAITLDGHRVRSKTRVAQVDAGHVALATVLEDRGVDVRSYYTGRDELGTSHVAHVLLAPTVRDFDAHELNYLEIPVMYARRRCLYDHLQRVSDFLRELGNGAVAIDVLDEALLDVEA